MQGSIDTGNISKEQSTILIVDDQPINLELLVKILKEDGYTTRPTLNGQVALGAVMHTPPDLILLDIRMPEMDGYEVCKQLKANPRTCHIPVIFISALDDIDEKVKAFQVGGVDFISRPFQPLEVLARVATHLELACMRTQMETLVRKRTTALEGETRKLAKEIATHQTTARQLRQSEGNYRFLVENQNELVIKTDAQHRLLFVNPNVCHAFGKTEDDLIGRQVIQLIDNENHKAVQDTLAALATPPHHGTYQGRTQTQQGWRWFEWSAKARLDTKGNIIDVVSVGRDITEAKAAETALKTSEENFVQLTENIRDIFWIGSLDFNEIFYVSPAYEQVWGRSCKSLYQDPKSCLTALSASDRHKLLHTIATTIDGKTQQINYPKYRIKRPDGTKRWIQARAFPICDSEGQPYRLAGFAEDITQAVEMETKLRQTYKMEAIGTLAGGIAHEFNNVLGIIIGNTELVLDDTPAGALGYQYLNEVFKASMRGRDVVKQLLNFSRKTVTERVPIDMAHTVNEALQLIKASLPATVVVELNIAPQVHTVVADATQINQLIFNLCNNASQAMSKNGGYLTIAMEDTAIDSHKAHQLGVSPGAYVKLSVSDTGHGMAAAIMEKIFDPYFTGRAIGRGTGMGLSIVHGIVESHNGAIAVQSKVDYGTCFDIYLPASQTASTPSRKRLQVLPTGDETILFIDDEPAITKIAKTLLSRLGYTIHTENDPAKALQYFQAAPDAFDLVISDITMPHITGEQLATEMLKIRKQLPIILCTGNSDRIDNEKIRAIGVRHHIEKPFDKEKIATIIRQVFDNPETDQQDTSVVSYVDQQPPRISGSR